MPLRRTTTVDHPEPCGSAHLRPSPRPPQLAHQKNSNDNSNASTKEKNCETRSRLRGEIALILVSRNLDVLDRLLVAASSFLPRDRTSFLAAHVVALLFQASSATVLTEGFVKKALARRFLAARHIKPLPSCPVADCRNILRDNCLETILLSAFVHSTSRDYLATIIAPPIHNNLNALANAIPRSHNLTLLTRSVANAVLDAIMTTPVPDVLARICHFLRTQASSLALDLLSKSRNNEWNSDMELTPTDGKKRSSFGLPETMALEPLSVAEHVVSSFFFLRFLVPAVIMPSHYGFLDTTLITPDLSKALLACGKLLITLSGDFRSTESSQLDSDPDEVVFLRRQRAKLKIFVTEISEAKHLLLNSKSQSVKKTPVRPASAGSSCSVDSAPVAAAACIVVQPIKTQRNTFFLLQRPKSSDQLGRRSLHIPLFTSDTLSRSNGSGSLPTCEAPGRNRNSGIDFFTRLKNGEKRNQVSSLPSIIGSSGNVGDGDSLTPGTASTIATGNSYCSTSLSTPSSSSFSTSYSSTSFTCSSSTATTTTATSSSTTNSTSAASTGNWRTQGQDYFSIVQIDQPDDDFVDLLDDILPQVEQIIFGERKLDSQPSNSVLVASEKSLFDAFARLRKAVTSFQAEYGPNALGASSSVSSLLRKFGRMIRPFDAGSGKGRRDRSLKRASSTVSTDSASFTMKN